MPKGKAKKDNPDMYQRLSEPSERNMTVQAAAHRRGGTHKVRDEDRTDSVYDTYNYKELLDVAKERGIYRKDMKKVEMARALKRNDEEKRRTEHDAIMAHRRRQQEAKREEERIAAARQKQIEAKQLRRVEKMKKMKRDESVSDDVLSETDIETEQNTRDEYTCEALGQALSDSSWDSTSSESSTDSVNLVIKSASRLRLFEWPYPIMPSTTVPSPLYPLYPLDATACPVFQPRQIPYAPLKLITTFSKQKISLPGLKYPAGVAPDFVPILAPRDCDCARMGQLTGILRNAIVETGQEWAARTIVQGWNAHMYLLPGPRKQNTLHGEKNGLADVYRKWKLEDGKARRVTRNRHAERGDKEERWRRRGARVRMGVEVFETCTWAPRAVGYVPAFLDWGGEGREDSRIEQEKRTLETLRYVRFKGCDVPNYYFWVGEAGEVDVVEGKTAVLSASLDTDEAKKEDDDGLPQTQQRFPQKRPYKLYDPSHDDDDDGDQPEPHLEEVASNTSETLYRRSSNSFPCHHGVPGSSDLVTTWLDRIPPSYESAL